ncbi:hypothetical protein ACSD7O_19180 [Methylorubrum extorquens]|uniref:hypothetical protein n=1 Tax=Methylorubrum extorquens TaxID=408 RepID=UPI003F5F2246
MTTDTAKRKRAAGKLGAKKLTPEEQKRRFIEAEQAAGASEDEAEFDANLKRIARTKAGLS